MSSVPPGPAHDRPGSPDGLRTGAQYLADIGNDGRQVIYDGEIVRDVTTHPAFSGAARSIAGLWDIAADPANRELMTYPSPRTGRPVLGPHWKEGETQNTMHAQASADKA